ncbi:MAG: saccharopine dehydrogenase C-terminal domain-containing protein [Methanobacteriota archaeon]
MKRVIVLGAGRVGGLIARDLKERARLDVTVADVRPEALKRLEQSFGLSGARADLSSPNAVKKLARDFDLAVGAVPGFMGLATLGAVIEAGADCCDISFMPEDPLPLDKAAKKAGVTVVVDCGVAPGLSNMMAGRIASEMNTIDDLTIMVGGLPKVRTWPYEYKAGFSPIDVIEEYTRPARLVRGGRTVVEPALSGVEPVDFPGVGTLEAFNSDGLRTLIDTIRARNMREMTLRYPGHAEKMRTLRETGLFGLAPVDVKGAKVRPIDLTTKLLFPMWEMGPGDEDMTVMRVQADGSTGKSNVTHAYDLLDHYDPSAGATSMSRTTGFTCSIVSAMIASGRYKNPGVVPPEVLGRDAKLFAKVLGELGNRGVKVAFSKKKAKWLRS